MPQLLRDIVASIDAKFVIPVIHIIVVIILAYVVLKLIDSALNRLRLIIHSADVTGVARVEQRAETLRHILRSVSKAIVILTVAVAIAYELGFCSSLYGLLAPATIAGLALGFGAQS